MTTTDAGGNPIYSELAGDPDFGELVELYVQEMPDRIALLEASLASGDRQTLRRTAHQLKGSAGGYGFPAVTQPAAALEQAVDSNLPRDRIESLLDSLVHVCERLSAEKPR